MRQAISRVKVNLERAQRKKRAAVGKEKYVTEKIYYLFKAMGISANTTQILQCVLCVLAKSTGNSVAALFKVK